VRRQGRQAGKDVALLPPAATVGRCAIPLPAHRRPSLMAMNFSRSDYPFLGFGVGLRRPHYILISESHPKIDWLEVIAENFMVQGGRPLHVLEKVRDQYPIALHGVSLSIGSADPLNFAYLRDLAQLIRRFEPAWISDHLCWTSIAGRNSHDLLPLPYTDETVSHVAQRVRVVQETLGRPLLLENVSSYMSYAESTLTEWQFLTAVSEEADCGILLDVNNVFVSAFNHGFSAESYIDAIPVKRVAQFHLAGHSDFGRYLLDTHDHPICDGVWALYERAVARFGPVSTLIEWDDNIPEFPVLAAAAEDARAKHHRIMELREVGIPKQIERPAETDLPTHHRA